MGGRPSTAALLLLASLVTACARAPRLPRGPTSAPAPVRDLLAEGDAARRRGAYALAERAYASAVEAGPGAVPAHLRYVALLLAQGRRSEALATYRRRAAAEGATLADRTMHARLETDGSPDALRGTYVQAAGEDPSCPWWPLALAEVEVAAADTHHRAWRAARDRTDRRVEQLEWEAAHEALARADAAVERAAALGPDLAETALYRGLAWGVRGDLENRVDERRQAYARGAAALSEATRLDPDLVEAWEALGDLRARLDDDDGSLAAFLQAADLQPEDAHLRLVVGLLLQRTGRPTEAMRQFQQAARLAPRDAEPWSCLGDACTEDERWDDALAAYAEAQRRDPRAVEVLYHQGTVLEHVGRTEEARTSYERYLERGGEREAAARRRIERILRGGAP